MIDALSNDRFHDLIAAYGADPERWPAGERSGAVKCLVESETVRTAWREAAELDGGLDSLTDVDVSPELTEGVIALAATTDPQNADTTPGVLHHVLPYAVAAAIALVVGIAVPSPFRGATVAPQPIVAAIGDTEILTDNGADLTSLALVDVTTVGDEDSDTGATLDFENALSQLPLL